LNSDPDVPIHAQPRHLTVIGRAPGDFATR
jgi:hypothetical protein